MANRSPKITPICRGRSLGQEKEEIVELAFGLWLERLVRRAVRFAARRSSEGVAGSSWKNQGSEEARRGTLPCGEAAFITPFCQRVLVPAPYRSAEALMWGGRE